MDNLQQDDASNLVLKENLLMIQQENVNQIVMSLLSYTKIHPLIDVFKPVQLYQIYITILSL